MTIYINARFLTQITTGVQRYAIECSRQIKQLYPNVVLLAPKNILQKDIASELNALVIGNKTGHLWEQIDLPRYLKRQNASILINLANTAPIFFKNNLITIHDLAFYFHPEWNSKSFSRWYNFLIPRIAKKAKHIFTVSKTVKNELVQYLKIEESKISVTYNGLSKAILCEPKNKEKASVILAVGSFNKRKNHDKLINAFINTPIKKQYTLVIVGDKHEVFNQMDIDEKTVKDNNIQIVHRLEEKELIDLFKKAEIVVSLSSYEGFGIPVLEGLYFGAKVLCADIPVYRELFDNYVYFCDIKNETAISHSLQVVSKASQPGTIEKLLEKYNYKLSANTIINKIK